MIVDVPRRLGGHRARQEQDGEEHRGAKHGGSPQYQKVVISRFVSLISGVGIEARSKTIACQ